MKIVAEIDTRSVAETVKAEELVVEVVIVDGVDGIDKNRGIALL